MYGCAGSEAKRCVLRGVEAPVRAQAEGAAPGELRPAFLALLDECPRGAETLLTRLVHIFTEKGRCYTRSGAVLPKRCGACFRSMGCMVPKPGAHASETWRCMLQVKQYIL